METKLTCTKAEQLSTCMTSGYHQDHHISSQNVGRHQGPVQLGLTEVIES